MGDAPTAEGGIETDADGRTTPGQSALDPFLVSAGLGLLGPILAIVLSIPVLLADLALGLPLLATLALGLIAGQYVAFGGLALGYLRSRGLDWGGVRDYLGVEVPGIRDLLVVLGGWLLIFGSVLVLSVLVQFLPTDPAPNQSAEQAFNNPEIIPPLIVAMFLVVGPSEEILYRGVVQGRMREHFGPVVAIVFASAIFALVHFVALSGGGAARLLTISILFVPSLVFGAVYEYTENLVVPALVHGLHNSVLLALLWVQAVYGPEMGESGAAAGAAVLAALPV
jgi:membrane protease YdiL (CAAX protease family)